MTKKNPITIESKRIARFWHRVENDRMHSHVRPVIILASMHDDIARQLVVKFRCIREQKAPDRAS